MEISPRRSLSLDFDTPIGSQAASSYPPTYGNWMPSPYAMHGIKSCSETKLRRPFVMTKSSLSIDTATMSIGNVPKKENFISSIFGAFTNMIAEGFAKIPGNFIANINNNLSVTVVPNEGIISPEFFKSLTRSSEQLAVEQQQKNNRIGKTNKTMNGKLSNETLYDAKNSIFTENIEKLPLNSELKIKDTCDEKSSLISADLNNELDVRLAKVESSNINFEFQRNPLTMKVKEIERIRSNIDESDANETNEKIMNVEKSCSSRSAEPNITKGQEKMERMVDESKRNDWQKMFRSVLNGCSSGIERFSQPRALSPDSELPPKRPNLSKTRRKTCPVARGRGKGRGKSQLRRNGVSQSRHRKERTKQNIYSNIQDDIEDWENPEDRDLSDDENDDQSRNERLSNDLSSTSSFHDSKNCPVLIESLALDVPSSTRKLSQRFSNVNSKCPMRVRYVPEASMEVDNFNVDEHDCSSRIDQYRPRLVSESSVDSEDSYCIVFENGSESEYTDYYDDTSDDEMDDVEKSTRRVRFNLKPEVHMMIKWDYAYRAARPGPWEEMARDRERFRGRIHCIERILDPILSIQHRRYIWQNRFGVDG